MDAASWFSAGEVREGEGQLVRETLVSGDPLDVQINGILLDAGHKWQNFALCGHGKEGLTRFDIVRQSNQYDMIICDDLGPKLKLPRNTTTNITNQNF